MAWIQICPEDSEHMFMFVEWTYDDGCSGSSSWLDSAHKEIKNGQKQYPVALT